MAMHEKAQQISTIVNSTSFYPMEVGVELATDHPYLQNELFKACVHFMAMLADKYDKGRYDGRNEYACQCSKLCIDALIANDVYDKEYFDRLHTEILAKMR